MKITIFRIIQECLNNIIKHSQATHVNIHLQFEEKNVRITVLDNGIGFDHEEVKKRLTSRPSLGLAGMEERHVSGLSSGYWPRALALFEANLARDADGRPYLNRVDLERGY